MHRSGTSIAARILDVLGVDFGQVDQLMGPGPDNAQGYWENRHIKELDDELLAMLGGSWDQPPVLDRGWQHDTQLDAFRERAASILDGAFGRPDERQIPYGWKDPRLSLLLPFWRTVADVSHTVAVIRDPLEVAASLERRNGMGREHACLLWIRYVLSAWRTDPAPVLVHQRDLVIDLPGSMTSLSDVLQLGPPDAQAVEQASAALDRKLVHHESVTIPAEPDPLTTIALLVWNGGTIDLDAIPEPLSDAFARGWLRSPVETQSLDQARAKVVELTERLRKRARTRKAEASAKTSDG
jgi:hypothetical protein